MGKKYIRANMATKFIAPYRLFIGKTIIVLTHFTQK